MTGSTFAVIDEDGRIVPIARHTHIDITTPTVTPLSTYAARGVAAAQALLDDGDVPASVLTDDCAFHGKPDFCRWHDHVDANELLSIGFDDSWDDSDDSTYDAWSERLQVIGAYVQTALDAVFYGEVKS